MRFLISILFLSFTYFAHSQDCELKYNGAYVCITERATHGFNEFIRFYENGEVITAISVYNIHQSIDWFHNTDESISQGSYEQNGCEITFATRSSENKFYYEGTVDGDYLKLKVLYPGKKKKEMVELEFEFVKIKLK